MLQMAEFAATGTAVSAPGEFLVVEDEQQVSMYLVDLLDYSGHEVRGTAHDLPGAMTLARTGTSRPAAIHHLPGYAGGMPAAHTRTSRLTTEIRPKTGESRMDGAPGLTEAIPVAAIPKPCDHKQLTDTNRTGVSGMTCPE